MRKHRFARLLLLPPPRRGWTRRERRRSTGYMCTHTTLSQHMRSRDRRWCLCWGGDTSSYQLSPHPAGWVGIYSPVTTDGVPSVSSSMPNQKNTRTKPLCIVSFALQRDQSTLWPKQAHKYGSRPPVWRCRAARPVSSAGPPPPQLALSTPASRHGRTRSTSASRYRPPPPRRSSCRRCCCYRRRRRPLSRSQ